MFKLYLSKGPYTTSHLGHFEIDRRNLIYVTLSERIPALIASLALILSIISDSSNSTVNINLTFSKKPQ